MIPSSSKISDGGCTYSWSHTEYGGSLKWGAAIDISSTLQLFSVEVTLADQCMMQLRLQYTLGFMFLTAGHALNKFVKLYTTLSGGGLAKFMARVSW